MWALHHSIGSGRSKLESRKQHGPAGWRGRDSDSGVRNYPSGSGGLSVSSRFTCRRVVIEVVFYPAARAEPESETAHPVCPRPRWAISCARCSQISGLMLSTSSLFILPNIRAIALVSRPAMRHSSITPVK